jgi:hypothetical protein
MQGPRPLRRYRRKYLLLDGFVLVAATIAALLLHREELVVAALGITGLPILLAYVRDEWRRAGRQVDIRGDVSSPDVPKHVAR